MKLPIKNKKIGTSALIVSIIVILGKIFGFLREIVLSYYYGATITADAYIMSINIVGVLFGWFSTLYICYTPIYTQVKQTKGEKYTINFSRTVITIFEIVAFCCVIFVYCFPSYIVKFIAPGFNAETVRTTVDFLKIAVLNLLIYPFIYPMKAYLECNGYFQEASAPDLSISIIQIIIIVISGYIGAWLLPYAGFFSYFVQGILIIYFAQKRGLKYRPEITGLSEIKLLLTMLIPYFVSSLIVEINNFVDRYFASTFPTGSIAMMSYASLLNTFLISVFSMPLITIIYPQMSKMIAENRMEDYESILKKGIAIIIAIFIPLTAGVMLLAPEFVLCVYGYGEFPLERINETANILRMYAVGLMATALREVLLRAIYSTKNMKLPIVLGLLSTGTNIVLDILLVKLMGAMGLALASSVSIIVTLPVCGVFIKKRYKIEVLKGLKGFTVVSLCGTSVLCIVVLIFKNYLNKIINSNIGNWVTLLTCAVVGASSYFMILLLYYTWKKHRKKKLYW